MLYNIYLLKPSIFDTEPLRFAFPAVSCVLLQTAPTIVLESNNVDEGGARMSMNTLIVVDRAHMYMFRDFALHLYISKWFAKQ